MVTNYDDEAEVEKKEEVEVQVEEEVVEEEEDTTDWKKVAEERQIELDKAQRAIMKNKEKPATTQKTDGLSTFDVIAIARANIENEDLDLVTKYSKMENISIAEALKSDVLKAILADKAEKRQSANATHTGSARRATAVVSEDKLLEEAKSGKMPETDADMAKLIEARLKSRK